MHLTKEEFCLFNSAAKLQLVDEFGCMVWQKVSNKKSIAIYKIYDFHLEVVTDTGTNKLISVNMLNIKMLNFYMSNFKG